MRSRLVRASVMLILSVLAGCTGNAVSTSAPSDVMSVSAAVNETVMRLNRGDRSVGPTFDRHAATLTRLLETEALGDFDRLVATYARGKARFHGHRVRTQRGEAADLALARDALRDFDDTVALADRIGATDPLVADAEYLAAGATFNLLKQEQTAFTYYTRCAARGHPGCASVVAFAMMTGSKGIPQDVGRSLAAHRLIVRSGIAFRCAGAFSAQAIAYIVHFTAHRAPDDDPVAWISSGISLIDELEATEGTKDACFRPRFRVSEYLLRLARGEKDTALLTGLRDRNADPALRTIAAYLLGQINEPTFTHTVDSSGSPATTRCESHFLAMWHAHINREPAVAQKHYEAVLRIDPDACRNQLFYAQHLGYRAAGT